MSTQIYALNLQQKNPQKIFRGLYVYNVTRDKSRLYKC